MRSRVRSANALKTRSTEGLAAAAVIYGLYEYSLASGHRVNNLCFRGFALPSYLCYTFQPPDGSGGLFSDIRMDAKNSLGEPRCLISRAAILHNIGLIRKAIGPEVKICAVVKADAYGHGADIVVDTLCNFSNSEAEPPMVDALAVADIDEAAALMACDLPVIVLRPVENAYLGSQRARLEAAMRHGWVLSLCSAAAAQDVARIAEHRGQRANVQIMLNTGMNRAGRGFGRIRQALGENRLASRASFAGGGDAFRIVRRAGESAEYRAIGTVPGRHVVPAAGAAIASAPQRGEFRRGVLSTAIASGHGAAGDQHLRNRSAVPAGHGSAAAAGDEMDGPADRHPRGDGRNAGGLWPDLDRREADAVGVDPDRLCRWISALAIKPRGDDGVRAAGAGGRAGQHGPDGDRSSKLRRRLPSATR